MNKLQIILTALFLLSHEIYGQLQVHQSGRYIVHSDDQPFFWLGDTAWELFHRLTQEEARSYLKNRAALGFNVIQAVALAELDGLTVPNTNGHLPLTNNDPSKPNEIYFAHIDAITDITDSLGMYTGLLPTWGDKFNKKWGVGPEIFNLNNAYQYGQFIANRYKNKKIIWIMGGDRNPETPAQKEIIESMAHGIRSVVGRTQLMTYHTQGGSNSTDFFAGTDWLDLSLFQSGHWAKDYPNFQHTTKGYAISPVIPVIDGEPCYEDHPINWKPEIGWYTDFDTRRAGYWSVLSGAAGHTFGNHNIWQMWQEGRFPISVARTPWQQAINYPGAKHAGIMKRIFEEIHWEQLVPDQQVIKNDGLSVGQTCKAASSSSILVVYTPYGNQLTLDMSKWTTEMKAIWIDPRSGNKILIGKIQPTSDNIFDPPYDPKEGNDWLLVLTME